MYRAVTFLTIVASLSFSPYPASAQVSSCATSSCEGCVDCANSAGCEAPVNSSCQCNCGLLSDNLWTRPQLFGDWRGARPALTEHGIVPDLRLSQFLQEVQGVELYYNAAITSWFHFTGDMQFVDNAIEADDTAVILGLRATIDL